MNHPRRTSWLAALALLLATGCAPPDASTPEATAASPYAAEQDRTIKALSAEEIEGYRTGQGLGLAMAAELNHYPGPKHVLELADSLSLSDEQRQRAQALFDSVKAEAIPLGEQIVAAEAALDALFADAAATPETLRTHLQALGALQADLRYVHLRAHLAMRDALAPAQIQHYDALRGYAGDHAGHDPSRHSH